MKIVVGRDEFLRVLTLVKHVPLRKDGDAPVLSRVLLSADLEDGILVSATDLVTRLDAVVEGDVEAAGGVTVSAGRLVRVLDSLPDGDVSVSLDKWGMITLKAGDAVVRLNGGAADEFPGARPVDEVVPVVVEQVALSRLLGSVAFAMCEDAARHQLCGTRLEFDAGRLGCIATDGKRLSVNELGVSWDGAALSVTVPGKTVLELVRLLGSEGDVRVGCTDNLISFSFDGVRLTSGLIDGSYANYDSILALEGDKHVSIERAAFIEVLGRAVAVSTKEYIQVRLTVEASVMHVDSVTPEVGDYHEDLVCVLDGEPAEVTLNPLYLIDVLAHVKTERVWLSMKNAASPVMLTPYSAEAALVYRNVLMPIQGGLAGGKDLDHEGHEGHEERDEGDHDKLNHE